MVTLCTITVGVQIIYVYAYNVHELLINTFKLIGYIKFEKTLSYDSVINLDKSIVFLITWELICCDNCRNIET